jgi:hypothetical protein
MRRIVLVVIGRRTKVTLPRQALWIRGTRGTRGTIGTIRSCGAGITLHARRSARGLCCFSNGLSNIADLFDKRVLPMSKITLGVHGFHPALRIAAELDTGQIAHVEIDPCRGDARSTTLVEFDDANGFHRDASPATT